jgi:hypothetical protein
LHHRLPQSLSDIAPHGISAPQVRIYVNQAANPLRQPAS